MQRAVFYKMSRGGRGGGTEIQHSEAHHSIHFASDGGKVQGCIPSACVVIREGVHLHVSSYV